LDASGGYLVAPEQFSATVITRLQNTVALRPLCTIIQVPKAASVGVPAFDDTPVAASWTSELSIGSEQSIEFAKRELTPHPLATYCKASKKLIRLATTDVSAFIAEQLSYGFAVAEEQAFMTGTGVAQPLGLFTASAMGIGTDRDVSTDNTATQIRADNLIEVCHTLKSQYRSSKSCRWIFSRTAVKQIRKLKDGSGDYLWKMGLAAGNPSTILDIPYIESEYAPATFTSGQYVGILGDLRFFYVADSLDFEIQVLTELYAANNQNGYIARRETDGMPVLSEAFVRVKLG
jgi:HK97 family phage major capsid protein